MNYVAKNHVSVWLVISVLDSSSNLSQQTNNTPEEAQVTSFIYYKALTVVLLAVPLFG